MTTTKRNNRGSINPSQNSNRYEVTGVAFEAFGDRILVEEDIFRSGYECNVCHGTTKINCDNCFGKGSFSDDKKCSLCDGSGQVTCRYCGGKGGMLVVPEVSQRRPTTGRIVSVGPDCKRLSLGQSVMYSSYCGYTVDLARAGSTVVMRILHEPEVLCVIEGHLELRSIRGKSDIAMATQ